MENLHYNLAEAEFSKSKKIMLWTFASLFFLAGTAVIFINVVLKDKSIHILLSAAPFGISIVVGIIAMLATFTRKDHYFTIDDDKIEFKYGMLFAEKHKFSWNDFKEIQFPHKQRKVRLVMKDDSSLIINLIWIEKKKSSHIRKHLYYFAKEKNIKTISPRVLSK